jgi:hypothetical protein
VGAAAELDRSAHFAPLHSSIAKPVFMHYNILEDKIFMLASSRLYGKEPG